MAKINLFGNGMIGYVKKENTTDERFYFIKDHLGSVRLTLNGSGIESGTDYYAYGGISRSVTYGEQKRYDFTEKERDAETGLHYFGARYYDSDISRWLSVDPLADIYPGHSPYSYVRNNPLSRIDLWGLSDTTLTHTLPLITVTASSSSSASFPIWISTGWGIALGEPTPVGEIIMGVGTGAYLTYSLYNTFNNEGEELNEPGETTDKIGKMAERFGKSKKAVKQAIHKIKLKNRMKGGGRKNTDVEVDLNTGEVYPKTPNGGLGDPIGNILDIL